MNGEIVGFEVDIETLYWLIVDLYETNEKCKGLPAEKHPNPLFIWGPTGIGKSQTVKMAAMHLAEKYGRKFTKDYTKADDEHFIFLDRRMSYRDPTEVAGICWPNVENKTVEQLYFGWLKYLSKEWEEKNGVTVRAIVLLDELDHTAPATQNACFELILDRRVEDLELADGVVIIAAGNGQMSGRYHTFELSDALKTRFDHVILKAPVFKDDKEKKGWYYWALKNDIDPRIITFLSFKPDMLWHYADNDRTFPTPRGWEKASIRMKGKPDDKAWMYVAMSCGIVAGQLFKTFLELSKKVDIGEILESPRKFLELRKEDRGYETQLSVVATFANLFKTDPKRYAKKLLKLAAVVYTGIPDENILDEYCELADKFENAKDSKAKEKYKAEMAKLRKKAVEILGEDLSSPELATVILHSMKYTDEELFKKEFVKSKYASALMDLLKFLI